MSDQGIYTVGGTVQASGGTYISREADEELLRLCRAGEFCYVLTPRQMGKSSLMVATRERLAAEGIRSVEIDLTQMGSKLSGLTAERWYLGLIDLIVDQLDLDVDYMAWWDERARLGPTQRLSQFLRQVVLEQVSEPVVIFIDEIDSTLNLDFTDDFFAAIRACYNARASDSAFKRLSFVLLGVATPSDLISDPKRTPFNIGRRMDLTDFTNDEAIPLAAGLGLPPVRAGQVLTWILEWTGGHPYLTQRLCAAAATSPTKNWAAAAIDKVVEKTFFGEQSTRDSNLQFVRDMLTQRPPDKAAVLKTYRRIHAGKAVPDEERSLVKTHLKLSGVVKRKEGNLTIRNRIYDQIFSQEWISQNMPRDWARRIAVISTILVLVLGGLFGYYRTYIQPQQTTEAQAQTHVKNFRDTTSADVRITSLAGLFELSGYEDQARQLFNQELGPDGQRALFERADSQAVGTQLVTVVKGLYTQLENNDQDNQLLEAMVQPLRELDDPIAVDLATEIEQWLMGRRVYASGAEYQLAVDAYSEAIRSNNANPATHFDRAIAYASLGRYEEALADFEETLRLDKERAEDVKKAIPSSGALYDALTANRAQYPQLVAVIPTPTSTSTFTPIPTPTSTFTPMTTPTSTFIPTPTDTLAPAPTPRPPTDTPTPRPPTDTLTPRPPTDTPTPAFLLGVFQDFENGGTWKRGDQPYGEFSRSTAQVYSGSYAGQLTYDFPTVDNEFVVFLQTRRLAGRPNAISAWVYGDNSGHYLNVWIKDTAGEVWQAPFGRIEHTGWQRMTAWLDPDREWPHVHVSGPSNNAIDYPISFYALVLDDIPDTFSGRGAIYVDDLASEEGTPPLPTPTPTQPGGYIVEISASPNIISVGGCTSLIWHIENVHAAYLNGEGITGPYGSKQVCPNSTTTYVLTVNLHGGGSDFRSVTVEVTGGSSLLPPPTNVQGAS